MTRPRESPYKTETRHHPLGKTCHHFVYHGLTCDEYDAMLAKANGHCEICGTAAEETPRGSLVVDHYTAPDGSRFMRGMLCDRCNNAVMTCIDGIKVWGANRRWEQKAREYEANSFDPLTPYCLAAMAARREMQPTAKPKALKPLSEISVIALPARHGIGVMAERLRFYLSPDQRRGLAGLLLAEDDEGSEQAGALQ